jgi:hypothetical protein
MGSGRHESTLRHNPTVWHNSTMRLTFYSSLQTMKFYHLYLKKSSLTTVCAVLVLTMAILHDTISAQGEFRSLFNGRDLSGWVLPEGDGGHWKVIDGIIDYDAMSESPGDKNLWTEEEFGDFVLQVDWRLKETPFINRNARLIRPDGTYQLNADGNPVSMAIPDSDSGIYLRGMSKAQVNIWCWPVGSGEVWGYRTDPDMPPEVTAGATPDTYADNHIGEWNTFEITMKGDRLTVQLNGVLVIDEARLPGVNERGAVALQHHGQKSEGEWISPPSLVQFRNIRISEL